MLARGSRLSASVRLESRISIATSRSRLFFTSMRQASTTTLYGNRAIFGPENAVFPFPAAQYVHRVRNSVC